MPFAIYGPTDTNVPTVYSPPTNPAGYTESLALHIGPWNALAGDVITVSFTSAVQAAGGIGFDIYLRNDADPLGTFAGSFGSFFWAAVAGGFTGTCAIPATGTYYVLLLDGGGGATVTGGTGTLRGLSVQTSGGIGTVCQYGTQLQPGGSLLVYITPGLIDVALTALGGGWLWLAPFFTGLWFTYVNAGTLCSLGPPPWPAGLTLDALESQPLDILLQALKVVLWPYLCRCTPAPLGGTAPVPPVFTAPTAPPGAPGQISLSCNDTDLCGMLNQMFLAIRATDARVRSIGGQVDLIQRQKVPFAYVEGVRRFALAGAGTFAVQGILGLSVETTSLPSYLSSDMAPVQSWFKLGEISTGTINGWTARRIVTHNPHLFLDIDGDVTRVGYQFEPGVVANIVELLREP